MDTIESIISVAASMLNRPDLIPDMRSRARNLLFRLHASADFERDIVQGTTQTPDPTTGIVTVLLDAAVRKPWGVNVVDTYNQTVPYDFKLRGVQPQRSYYGFTQMQATYYIAGGTMTLQCVYPFPQTLRLDTLNYPSWVVAVDGTVSSDSWLLQNYGDCLLYALVEEQAAIVEHKGWMAAAPAKRQEAQRVLELSERITTCILGG